MGFSFKQLFKAVVVAATVALVIGLTIGTGGATLGVYVATASAIAAATYTVSSLLAETPKDFDLGEQLRGQLITSSSPAADSRIVYGETRLGGNIVYIETTGAKNETMFQAITIAGHEIQSIETVFANDEALTLTQVGNAFTTTYKGNASALSFNFLLGTDTQSPLPFFAGTTAATYPFKGIAVLAAKLVFNPDTFPQGIPNLTVKLRGRKVFDPRTSTTAFSTNAALCIRDYLTNTAFGLGASAAELDDTSFSAAANICDEDIDLAAGGTEKRYTINGAFSSAEQPKEVIAKMLTACGGKLSYVGGKWTLRVAAYRSPTITLTEDDIIGPVTMQASQSRRDIFNAVKGTYSDPATLFQLSSFPPVTNATYEAEDNERIFKDVQFPFTTSVATCQRLAKIDLETARQQISLTLSCKLTAFSLQPGDTVNMNFERYGFVNKQFEVYNWTFNIADSDSGPTPQVDLVLRETASGIYDWNSGFETEVDLAPNTNLPDPFTVTPPGITITDELAIISEEVLTKLVVTISGNSTFQDFFEVQARKVGDTNFTNLGQASGNRFELPNVEDGANYEVRARSVNSLGVRSAFATGSHEVVGKTTPPQDVNNLSVNIIGTEAHLTWEAVTDLDLSHYKVRHSRLTVGAIYANSIDLLPKVSRPATTAVAPAMTGTYFIKAIDKLGNASLNPTATIAVIEDISGLNFIQTLTESPSFAGAKTEVDVSDGQLVLDTAIDFDNLAGLFDDVEGDFDGGGGQTSVQGFYEFANIVDLGAIYTSRVTAFVEVGRIDYVNTFDSAGSFFDDRLGLFDGDADVFDDVNVELQICTTDSDPATARYFDYGYCPENYVEGNESAWSNFRRFFVGDYKARALKFRAILNSNDTAASPTVNSLIVDIDMPDRVTAGSDEVSGTSPSGYSVIFNPAFNVAPAIGITAQNLQQGDFFNISSKTETGFTITFRNSSNTVVSRTFDYIAKGYGELVT